MFAHVLHAQTQLRSHQFILIPPILSIFVRFLVAFCHVLFVCLFTHNEISDSINIDPFTHLLNPVLTSIIKISELLCPYFYDLKKSTKKSSKFVCISSHLTPHARIYIYVVINCVPKPLTFDSFFSPPSCPPCPNLLLSPLQCTYHIYLKYNEFASFYFQVQAFLSFPFLLI